MSPRVVAALLGALAGLLLCAAGGLSFLAREYSDLHHTLAVTGYAVTLAALLVTGYALVAHAPFWLRIIVSIAFPLLMASVWQVVDQAIDDRVDGWRAAAATHLLGGVIVLVAALLAFRRGADRHADHYEPTHR
ncbi:membrane protein implicated in regulation of membrane protease activity [Marmoricola sp. URHA0025 HA25]